MGLMRRNVNWVIDADIRVCSDAIDHGWMIKCDWQRFYHRIARRRMPTLQSCIPIQNTD
jgi:retron-type reverse transcriptase